jgi:trans-aconitate methyltransferase/Icc-related predicted phosphoesterase
MTAQVTPRTSPYDGLATRYGRARPSYPSDSMAFLQVEEGDLVVDVGAGTGIFTRLLADRLPEARVIGIEASQDMYREAERASAAIANLSFMQGTAEALPLGDGSVRLLTVATAIHWFDRPAFYKEAVRCLRPDGELLVYQNIRRWWQSSLLADYETLHETAVKGYHRGRYPAAHGGYDELDVARELATRTDFSDVEVGEFTWSQQMSVDEFIDFSQSSSITQRAITAMGRGAYIDALRALLERHVAEGLVEISYLTKVTSAKPIAESRVVSLSDTSPRPIQVSHSPIRIIQISDPHLSAGRPFFQHNWEMLVDLLNEEPADVIVCTGDMTIDGANVQSDLAFASHQFERISNKVLFVPGNHDIGNSIPDVRGGETVITDARRQAYRRFFGNDCWVRDIGPSWRLVGLNSMLFGSGIEGEEQQWEMLEEAIRTAGDRSVMIFQHKPLYHRTADEATPTQSAVYPEHRARLKKILSGAKKLVACSGHIHNYRTAQWGKIAQVWAPATSFTMSIPGQKPLRGTRRVGYLRHTLDGAVAKHEFVEPCQFINTDVGNWGRDPRGFHARYGSEPLRGLTLDAPARREAVAPISDDAGLEDVRSAGTPRSATGA